MSSQTVTSPLDGSIVVLYQNSGNFIARGTPIAMIADFSKMYFTLMVNDKSISNIAPIEGNFSLHIERKIRSTSISTAITNIPAKSSFSDNTAFDVIISSIMPPFSESAPVRSMTCEVDNHLGVIELGMYTDIIIRKNTMKRVLAVPSIVVFEQNGTKVYVCDENSRLAIRDINTGVYDSEYIEITQGLKEGDIVITSGVAGLDPGIKIEVNVEGEIHNEME
jgi:RND family efflux transporter MFP subunit